MEQATSDVNHTTNARMVVSSDNPHTEHELHRRKLIALEIKHQGRLYCPSTPLQLISLDA